MTYDEIVVGSGAGGAVVAARLSEDPARNVLLIEAGPDFGSVEGQPEALKDPFVSFVGHDWEFQAVMNGSRVGPYPRGKTLGGSTAVNAVVAMRPTPGDFDRWVEAGVPRWSHEEVLPYFKKLESDPDGDPQFHGHDGPITIRRQPRESWQAITTAFAREMEATGHPIVEDHNDPRVVGVGPTAHNVRNGIRWSTAAAYLEPVRERENLTILADTLVDRVVIEDGRVVGVEVLGASGRERIDASRVTLAAGAICTPPILLRSGVGPRDDLAALDIPVVVDSPGVGKNLQDHPAVFVTSIAQPGIEQDPDNYFAFYSRRDDEAHYLALLALYSEQALGSFYGDPASEPVIAVAAGLGHPRSRGEVTITSTDANDAPAVDLRLLSDPEDRRDMRAGTRAAWASLSGPDLGPLVKEKSPVIAALIDDDDALDAFAAEVCGSGFHPVGTARMGMARSDEVVCDQEGRVFGVAGLRVADASLMPLTVSAPTNLTSIMIGERIAEFMKAADD